MSLIDYRGFRLIALSILPLETIVYGSNDGGISVYSTDNIMNDKMRQAAKILNIKGHTVGTKQETTFLYGPTDIEGHKGRDGRYYLLDFSVCIYLFNYLNFKCNLILNSVLFHLNIQMMINLKEVFYIMF